MTYEETTAYIENQTWSKTRLGLMRTRELLFKLNDPQKKLKFVHVAGTNGKGSTCAMTASVLTAAGYKTGFYPSPHIMDFRERIQIDGEYISKEDLVRITGQVREAAESMEDHPSQFEIVTAIGMLFFLEQKCDIVVLEVGMGGAMDSTNVIDAPEVCVITNIGLDHTEYLGNSIEEIAATKGGIIKRGSSVVCYDSGGKAVDVIRKISEENGNAFYLSDEKSIVPLKHDLDGQSFMYEGECFRLPLLGHFQLRNVALVMKIVEALKDRDFCIPVNAVRKGLENVKWPARFEVLSKKPLFILDGGHNPQCAEAFAENIREYLPDEKVILLVGMLKDKDYLKSIDIILENVCECVCITPESDRALSSSEMTEEIRKRGIKAYDAGNIENGVKYALNRAECTKKTVLAFGSLYSSGTIKRFFNLLKR